MKKEMTHTCVLVGDARHPVRTRVKLRETKIYWVTIAGVKYRKRSGWMAGDERWPIYFLDLESIRQLGDEPS